MAFSMESITTAEQGLVRKERREAKSGEEEDAITADRIIPAAAGLETV